MCVCVYVCMYVGRRGFHPPISIMHEISKSLSQIDTRLKDPDGPSRTANLLVWTGSMDRFSRPFMLFLYSL